MHSQETHRVLIISNIAQRHWVNDVIWRHYDAGEAGVGEYPNPKFSCLGIAFSIQGNKI